MPTEKPAGYRRTLYLLCVLALMAVLPSSVITYLLYAQAKSGYLEQLAIRLNNLAMDRELATRLILENQSLSFAKLAETPEIHQMALALLDGSAATPSEPLDRVLKGRNNLKGLLLIDVETGRHQLAGDFPPLFMARGVPELKNSGQSSLLAIEVMPDGERLFLLGRKIPHGEHNVFLLALANIALLDNLFVERSALGQTGESFLSDKNGAPLTPLRYPRFEHSSPTPIQADAMQDCLRGNTKSLAILEDYVDVKTAMSYRPVQGYGGCIMVHMRESELLSYVDSLRDKTVASVLSMMLFAALISAVVTRKIAKSEQMLLSLASTDYLTGVMNRYRFMQVMENELERSRRFSQTGSLLILDLDHFKAINDSYGHVFGDAVLKHFASVIARNLRSIDVFGRIGGEEFCILLPNTGLEGAKPFAERLCQTVAATPIEFDGTRVAYTVSIGATEFSPGAASLEHILERADAALYRAKNEGRNRAVVDTEPMP